MYEFLGISTICLLADLKRRELEVFCKEEGEEIHVQEGKPLNFSNLKRLAPKKLKSDNRKQEMAKELKRISSRPQFLKTNPQIRLGREAGDPGRPRKKSPEARQEFQEREHWR